MSNITSNKALARLAFQFSDSANFIAFASAFLAETDELYDSNVILLEDRNLDDAEGVQLDGIGQIVGIDRPVGYSDVQYLLMIKAKIMINSINMSVDETLELFEFVFGSDRVRYFLFDSLSPYYTIGGVVTEEEQLLFDLFPTTLGVRVTYISVPVYAEAFSFFGDDGLGFSTVTAPTTGGNFAYTI